MKILQMSSTPMAGVPYLLRDIINKYSNHECKAATGPSKYPDGRKWDAPDANLADIRKTRALLSWADVVLLHNGGMHRVKMYDGMLRAKRLLCYYHSEPSPPCPAKRVSRRWESKGIHSYVIAQGHSILYPKLPTLPNLVDIHHPLMKPIEGLSRPYIKIGYAPSNIQQTESQHRQFVRSYRYSSKGWFYTKPVLDKLASVPGVIVEIYRGVEFWECMKRRRDCHIVIDEVVTGSYHRSTLEAMSHGQVVVSGIEPRVEQLLLKAAGTNVHPIVKANYITLEDVMESLVSDKQRVHDVGVRSRQWMENNWEPQKMLERWYIPAFQAARKPK